jgi:hypothetical protein
MIVEKSGERTICKAKSSVERTRSAVLTIGQTIVEVWEKDEQERKSKGDCVSIISSGGSCSLAVLAKVGLRGTVVGFWIGHMNTSVIVISRTLSQLVHPDGKREYINGLLDRVRHLIGNAQESIRWRTKKRKARCYNEYPAFVAQVQSNSQRRLLRCSLQDASRRI